MASDVSLLLRISPSFSNIVAVFIRLDRCWRQSRTDWMRTLAEWALVTSTAIWSTRSNSCLW